MQAAATSSTSRPALTSRSYDAVLLGEGDVEAYAGPQEVLKANQCRDLVIEDSEVAHAFGTALDFFAVEGDVVRRNRIHHALDWCAYIKGGCATIEFLANELWDGRAGGFAAGQGSGFEFMVPPSIHYEASRAATPEWQSDFVSRECNAGFHSEKVYIIGGRLSLL